MKILTRFQGELLKEYKRTQKQLRMQLKRENAPEIVKAIIKESIEALTERQSIIIARYIYREYKKGLVDAEKELKGVNIEGAAAIPDMGSVGMKLDEVSQKQMNRIFNTHLGAIGDYNTNLSKTLQHQYNLLLNDNKLIKSLNMHGFTPWLEREWQKRGIAPEVIALIKGQKTSKQMITILEMHGIRGGKHPNEVAKMLVPHVNRFFGPEGVSIDNIGKTVKRFRIDADGNYGWFDHKITRKYKATPRTYSRLIARDTMRKARMDAYYDSLKGSKLVDHYISVAHMDSTTCGMCASMHGRTVTKGSGPLYHGNCGCDLRPVWKKDSSLASQNKSDTFFEKQRNTHFMRANDLKDYNAKMPRGMKLKYATQLPEDAITTVIPSNTEMRAIRHEMLGKPAAIKPKLVIAKRKAASEASTREVTKKPWGLTDEEWKAEADVLYKKTAKDGNEHLKLFNGKVTHFTGDTGSVNFTIPEDMFFSLHTHPGWNSPLSTTDIINGLETQNEVVGGATSETHIYLMRKTSETKAFNMLKDSKEFESVYMKAWHAAKRKVSRKGFYEGWEADVNQAGNKAVAKKWNFLLKIIKR